MIPDVEVVDMKLASILCASAIMDDTTTDNPVQKETDPNYNEFD